MLLMMLSPCFFSACQGMPPSSVHPGVDTQPSSGIAAGKLKKLKKVARRIERLAAKKKKKAPKKVVGPDPKPYLEMVDEAEKTQANEDLEEIAMGYSAIERDLEQTVEDLKEFLGEQWTVAWTSLQTGQPLRFLEVYVGQGEATNSVRARGALGIKLGKEYGQNFDKRKHRVLSYVVVLLLLPIHVWVSFPCTHWCCFIAINLLRSAPKITEGMIRSLAYLRHCRGLCSLQLEGGRHAHMENPGKSTAWGRDTMKFAHGPNWQGARRHLARYNRVAERIAARTHAAAWHTF